MSVKGSKLMRNATDEHGAKRVILFIYSTAVAIWWVEVAYWRSYMNDVYRSAPQQHSVDNFLSFCCCIKKRCNNLQTLLGTRALTTADQISGCKVRCVYFLTLPCIPWQQEGQYRVETENEDGEWVGILMRVSGVHRRVAWSRWYVSGAPRTLGEDSHDQ